MYFSFNEFNTNILISNKVPAPEKIIADLQQSGKFVPLVIADENTKPIAEKIFSKNEVVFCILKSGEENKNFQAIEAILSAACSNGLGRDAVFVGIGGGAICDLAGFAASIYKRGCTLVLIATTLLAMIDACTGGKTGFNMFGLKNLAGSFYPAKNVYIPLDCLSSLPQKEWKNGFAELIKIAVIGGNDFLDMVCGLFQSFSSNSDKLPGNDTFRQCVEKAVMCKGRIAAEDFRDNDKRLLLNLGHTFAHALESAGEFLSVSHGEAVACGIVLSCRLGLYLGITPKDRAEKIIAALDSFDYRKNNGVIKENIDTFLEAFKNDKKKKDGKLTFIVPDEKTARAVTLESKDIKLIENIIQNGNNF